MRAAGDAMAVTMRSGALRGVTIQRLKRATRQALHRIGLDVGRYPGGRTLLRSFGVDLVLDVGANEGQYGQELRAIGYAGRIISFEPLPVPFQILERQARRDPRWDVVNLALGDFDGRAEMHVSANSVSSSMLEMLPAHQAAAPDSAYIGVASVDIRRLDSIAGTYLRDAATPLLKIDAQGFERRILDGSVQSLPRIAGLQIELELEPLYEDSTLLTQMIALLESHGFQLMGLEPGFTDMRSGRLLQADGLFFRPLTRPGTVSSE
jgi:FkbM family methyltransferase